MTTNTSTMNGRNNPDKMNDCGTKRQIKARMEGVVVTGTNIVIPQVRWENGGRWTHEETDIDILKWMRERGNEGGERESLYRHA